MGRTPKFAGKPLKSDVRVRMTDAQRAALEAEAEATGATFADVVRVALDVYFEQPKRDRRRRVRHTYGGGG